MVHYTCCTIWKRLISISLHTHYVCALLCVLALLHVGIVSRASAQQTLAPMEEEQLQASFIWQFLQLTEWSPPQALPENIFTLGIVGTSRVEEFLEHITRNRKLPDGKTVVLRKITTLDDIERCRAVYVCVSETLRLPQILARSKNKPVLTIGRDPQFIEKGGIINFFAENNRLRYEINLDEASTSSITFSSKLLRFGRLYKR